MKIFSENVRDFFCENARFLLEIRKIVMKDDNFFVKIANFHTKFCYSIIKKLAFFAKCIKNELISTKTSCFENWAHSEFSLRDLRPKLENILF